VSRLKALREAAGYSTRELADAAGIGLVQIWRFEHGTGPKGLKPALALAAALRCKVTDIWPDAKPVVGARRPHPRPQHAQSEGASMGTGGRGRALKSGGKRKR
jgi:transcriptional regulator with XRE-family HTH domain